MANKRFFALLLTLCMTLSLAACGQSSQPAAPSGAPQEAAPAAPADPAPAEPEVNWPGKDTITVVCPYGAGGDTDFMARLTFEKVQEKLGGNFIVQNITGNSGAVGSQTVLEADPDGKTILFYHTAMLVNEGTGLTPFGFRDFDFVCIPATKDSDTWFMRADNKYGIKDFNDLRNYTQAHPGELTMTYQAGGTSHLTAQMLVDAGVDVTLVDIGGKSEQLAALLGGQVDVAALAILSAREYVDSGEFISVGYAGKENPLYDPAKYRPLKEYGVNVSWPMLYCVMAPKGTDPAIVKLLSDTIGDIVANDADFSQRAADAFFVLPEFHGYDEAPSVYETQEKVLAGYVQTLMG